MEANVFQQVAFVKCFSVHVVSVFFIALVIFYLNILQIKEEVVALIEEHNK